MIEIAGKHAIAKCFATNIDARAVEQVRELCDQQLAKGQTVRIMPDAHAGAGCVIGCTMTVGDAVIPNVVGVDIGCGMYAVSLGLQEIDFEALDRACHAVPSGFDVWDELVADFDLKRLRCKDELCNVERIRRSMGTLGGGNHFIEVDCEEGGECWLVIHSGSRNLGKQVAEFYQRRAIDENSGKAKSRQVKEKLIAELKAAGRSREIQAALVELGAREYRNTIPPDLCPVTGRDFEDYLYDASVCAEFASQNRESLAEKILEMCGLAGCDAFHTVHNYIDTDEMVLRKGAVRAGAGERLLIPLNMRDGSVMARGRGNMDWNNSAPHGAGRLMSRRDARERLDLNDFRASMTGIYTTSISERTLDEAPQAYKSADDILGPIGEAVDIEKIMRPVYNFKAQ